MQYYKNKEIINKVESEYLKKEIDTQFNNLREKIFEPNSLIFPE